MMYREPKLLIASPFWRFVLVNATAYLLFLPLLRLLPRQGSVFLFVALAFVLAALISAALYYPLQKTRSQVLHLALMCGAAVLCFVAFQAAVRFGRGALSALDVSLYFKWSATCACSFFWVTAFVLSYFYLPTFLLYSRYEKVAERAQGEQYIWRFDAEDHQQ